MINLSIFENYATRVNDKDYSGRDRMIQKTRYSLQRRFEQDPAFFQLNSLEPDGVTNGSKRLKVVNADYVVHLNHARIKSRYFVAHPDDFIHTGTILFDLYNSDWMVTASANLTEIVDRGMMQKINYNAKWVEAGILKENLALVTSVAQRSDGTDSNHYLTMPEDAILIHIPKSEKTKSLKRDIRFMVEQIPYVVTRVDRYTDENLIFLTAVEDLLKDGDSIEKGVCDYHITTYEGLEIVGNEFIRQGMNNQYILKNNGEKQNATWEVLQGSEFLQIQQVEDYVLNIKTNLNGAMLGKNIEIQATLGENVETKMLTITSFI